MRDAVIRILLCGLAGALLGYLTYGAAFSGFALGLFVAGAVLPWQSQRDLPHAVPPRSPLPPMLGFTIALFPGFDGRPAILLRPPP